MTAGELQGHIDQFVKEHASDRQVMPILSQLKTASRTLGRLAGNQDKSKQTPGQQAASRSGGGPPFGDAAKKMRMGAANG